MAIARPKPRSKSAACCPTGKHLRAIDTAGYLPTFRALGDETRLSIVGLLAAQKSAMCVCDIEAHVGLTQGTVSHHLRVLREAGLVTHERRATWAYYALDPGAFQRLSEFGVLVRP